MSHTCGLTAAPPPCGGAEMVVLMPPVAAKPGTACSWYCQRLCTGGCQQPVHAVGAGSAAAGACVAAPAVAAPASAATVSASNRNRITTGSFRWMNRVARAVHHSPSHLRAAEWRELGWSPASTSKRLNHAVQAAGGSLPATRLCLAHTAYMGHSCAR